MAFDRTTLKRYFSAGARPTEDQFGALIDSTLIMVDEGFEKTEADGLRILTKGTSNALVSFGRPGVDPSQWRLDFHDNGSDALLLQRSPHLAGDSAVPALSLRQSGPDAVAEAELAANLAIGHQKDKEGNPIRPRNALDVRGVVRADGRLGREVLLPANGKPQTLSEPGLQGCVAFEIMAGVGREGSGRFALMHAIAMNTFNPSPWDNLLGLKRRIRCQHAYYRRRSDRLKLRWAKSVPADEDARHSDDPNEAYGRLGRFELQISTRTDYEDPEVQIRAFITQLWFDNMAGTPDRSAVARQGAELPGYATDPTLS